MPRAIEELLRIEPPGAGPGRCCTRDTVLGGRQIKAGEQLFIHLTAANRDSEEFENPHELDFERERNRHLAFGAGHHRCLGATFARQNIRVALEEILSRMHDIRLVDADPPRRASGIVWGMEYLPLTFTPGSRVGTGRT